MRFAPLSALLCLPALVGSLAWAAPDTAAEARALLEAASKNVASTKGVSFTGTFSTMGMGLSMGGTGAMNLVRGTDPLDKTSSFSGTGNLQVPALADGAFNFAMLKGETVQWIDSQRKALVQRGSKVEPVTPGAEQAARALALLFPPFLLEANPFETELKTTEVDGAMKGLTMQVLRDEPVGGVNCAVISGAIKEGETERLIWVGRDDKYPRGYEQARTRGARIGRTWMMTNVALHPDWTHDSIALKAPEGFATDIQAAPAPQPTTNNLPPKPVQQPTAQPGGPQLGQAAPVITGKSEAGAFSMDLLKGKPAIVVFWSPLFPASAGPLKAVAEVGKGEAGKGAAVIALAVRAESMDRPALGAAFTNLGGPAGATLLTDANDSLTAYTVRGFPSTVVINAEGRVVGFFEGDVTVAELNAALKGQPMN